MGHRTPDLTPRTEVISALALLFGVGHALDDAVDGHGVAARRRGPRLQGGQDWAGGLNGRSW